MSASENAAAIRHGYEAFARGDLATLRELLAPDVKWHVAGRSELAGTREGVEAVLTSFMELATASGGTFRTEIHDVLANDDHTVVLARSSADRRGRHFEDNYCHVCHISGGRITESWIMSENPYGADEFWTD